jgi:hypothetical protein
LPRAAATRAAAAVSQTYARKKKRPRKEIVDIAEDDDSDHEMIDVAHDQHGGSDSEEIMEEDEDSRGPAPDANAGFQLNDDLLI